MFVDKLNLLQINVSKKFQLDQHINTSLHRERKDVGQNSKQQLLPSCINQKEHVDSFNEELCRMMISCNIPLHNLDTPVFRNFLEKYTKEKVLSRRTISRKCVSKLYEENLQKIRNLVGDNYIWFSVDETTDANGRYIANFIVGILNGEPSPSHLIAVKELEKTNHLTISRFVNETLAMLFLPGQLPYEKVLYMVTDGAAYMVKAGQNLKIFFPNLLHVTCMAHAMNRVAETVREAFPLVNKLINGGKKVFLKAPSRVQVYKEMMENIPLPPQPILTRWGTWIEAALFYAEHIGKFKNVVQSFDAASSQCIADCQQLFAKSELIVQLNFIKANFSKIPIILKKLEEQNLLLSESISLVEDFRDCMKLSVNVVCSRILEKLNSLLTKNSDLALLQYVRNVIDGQTPNDVIIRNQIVLEKSYLFKYCPITSCDVERSFSRYKNLLEDNRRSFLLENLERHMIIYCNNFV
jgi:hypothetical protein